MSRKTLILIGLTVGSLIGGYVPVLFGAGLLSTVSIIGNTVGAIIGTWITYKLTQDLD